VVETIEDDGPADLGEALALVGEEVTAAGNQPLALDDPGVVWRVTSGQVDVFYSRPEPGQDRGRRRSASAGRTRAERCGRAWRAVSRPLDGIGARARTEGSLCTRDVRPLRRTALRKRKAP
jgi:hypothetical protein